MPQLFWIGHIGPGALHAGNAQSPKGDDSLRLGFGGPEHFLLSKPPRLRPLSRHRLLDLPADLPAGALAAVRAGNARCQGVAGVRALRLADRTPQAPETFAVG